MTEDISKSNGRPLVLVVDDDEDLRSLAGMQLGKAFEVLEASSGQECIEIISQRLPDVILLDMMMPGMSGAEVLDTLSADPRTRDIPVIFLSALDGIDDRVRALEGGALDFVTKPADWRELSARVGAAARVRARQEEILLTTSLDPVTGLPIRPQFEARLREEIARATRSSSRLAMLLIAVDDIENVQLRYGDDAVSELLHDIAHGLRQSLRTADSLFLYADAEFGAILPDTDVATAFLAAERLRSSVANAGRGDGPASISIGVSELSGAAGEGDLIARAEVALFRARESGGNLSWRSDDPRRRSLNPMALAEELTDREWDVLMHLTQRRTEQEIARRLEISAGTVRSHKARIRRKLHVPPEMRLSEFVRQNLGNLADRLARSAASKG